MRASTNLGYPYNALACAMGKSRRDGKKAAAGLDFHTVRGWYWCEHCQ
jgi:hypothetical protein